MDSAGFDITEPLFDEVEPVLLLCKNELLDLAGGSVNEVLLSSTLLLSVGALACGTFSLVLACLTGLLASFKSGLLVCRFGLRFSFHNDDCKGEDDPKSLFGLEILLWPFEVTLFVSSFLFLINSAFHGGMFELMSLLDSLNGPTFCHFLTSDCNK